jgi:tRNA uridine 5-carbamoylmethylation protein Kti12
MIILMVGTQGSGKSYQAKRLAEEHLKTVPYSQTAIVSADDFFVEDDGSYVYDSSKIGVAHSTCFRKFLEYMTRFRDKDLVVVDNTNMANWERTPYTMVGEAFGHKVKVVHVLCDPEICISRNTHAVPADVILATAARYENPFPWWEFEEVSGVECLGCGKPLLKVNRNVADGCPCNSSRGVNHGLVPDNTCTCLVCDPNQTGSIRVG